MFVTRVAVVPGGGTGIGRAVALALARDDFAVVIGGRRGQPLERVAAEARREQLEGVPVGEEVRDLRPGGARFARVKELYGRLDLLFNNAGANVRAVPLEELTFEAWQTV